MNSESEVINCVTVTVSVSVTVSVCEEFTAVFTASSARNPAPAALQYSRATHIN